MGLFKIKSALFAATFVLSVFSCKTMFETITEDTNKSANIRVNLLSDSTEFKIRLNKYIIAENDSNGDRINLKKNTTELILKKENDFISMNGLKLEFPVKIYSTDNRLITINDKKYFGIIKVIPESGEIKIINFVPTETYLMSVLLSEMPLSFDLEALKAQVIVARTYASLFREKYSKKRDFDVDNTTSYQVYKGYNVSLNYGYMKKIEKAVKDTEGQIITFDDKPILAYFHSNSGGKITSGKDYFGDNSDYPYLVNKEDPYSLNYPGSTWEYKSSIDGFLNLFGYKYRAKDSSDDEKNLNCEDLFSAFFLDDVNSGLYAVLDRYYSEELDKYYTGFSESNLKYSGNGNIELISIKDKTFDAKEIRKTIGNTIFKSIKFKININEKDGTIAINGTGYGHGVGLSQWGAEGMAEKGFKCNEIIDYYYPNTKITKIQDENIDF